MSTRRAFKAKVLAHSGGEYRSEVLTFGEEDSPIPINLEEPFVCLAFVEQQVRKRTHMHGVEDYEVNMNTLSNDGSGLVSDNVIVRPWRYPSSEQHYKTAS